MKILITYFSATQNTEKIARHTGQTFTTLGAEVTMRDITPPENRVPLNTNDFDCVVFGAPIHSWRAPRVVRDWMNTLEGKGKKAAMFFTYGGFGVHPCHYTTRKILEDANFTVVSSAEFPGAHTFNLGGWEAVADRPGEPDFAVAEEFARKTYRRFTGEDTGVPGEFEKTAFTDEFLDSIESYRFKALTQLPTREGRECTMCMVCGQKCPTGAMNPVTGEADSDTCIACLACVHHCQENALKINDMTGIWEAKLEMEKLTREDLDRKQSKIYL